MSVPIPNDEVERLAALRHYEILDTDPEQAFDDLTLLASFICGTPMSLVSLIDEDRQWYKSKVGLEGQETPRELAFCAHAIMGREIFEVPNAMLDARFADNPLVTGDPSIRFYAGSPLVNEEGRALGTLCVIDSVPRELSDEQREALDALGRQVMAQIELRRKLRDLKIAMQERNRLEDEKAVRDQEIERDLRFAREFQQALMPHSYPHVGAALPTENEAQTDEAQSGHRSRDGNAERLRLQFHHIYKPALSLGGDFFDVIKLSECRAGVFVADVMGHGARSALITAILRTLLQDTSRREASPQALLEIVNAHFYDIVQGSHQFVFASAFYLVLDTQQRQVHYASAGHPAPVLANRPNGSVKFLSLAPLQSQPATTDAALGMERNSTYGGFSHPVQEGDIFLLFTDGVVEAPDQDGEEFGEDRLVRVVRENIERDAGAISRAVEDAVAKWSGVSLPDDFCLVAIEAVADA